jgi:hypothetical protein
MSAQGDHERAARNLPPCRDTLVIAVASIIDGLVGVLTLGFTMTRLRGKASEWAGKRLAARQYWL